MTAPTNFRAAAEQSVRDRLMALYRDLLDRPGQNHRSFVAEKQAGVDAIVFTGAHVGDHDYLFWRAPFSDDDAAIRFRRDDGLDGWIDTQYGAISCPGHWMYGGDDGGMDTPGHPLNDVRHELRAAAIAHHAERRRVEAEREQARLAAERAKPRPAPEPMPDHIAALFARYGSAEAAWVAEDEQAWALMQPYDDRSWALDPGLPEDC